MPLTTAIVLGASGSVGQALVAEILRSGRFAPLILLARRPVAAGPDKGAQAGVVEHLVPDMQPQALEQAVVDLLARCDGTAVGFSALGVGAGTAALTIDQHRAVDVELNAAFARGLKRSAPVRHLVFMSAVGADPQARTTGSGAAGMPRYARVKGEAEQAVKAQGPQVVSILRPSVIIGSRHTGGLIAGALALMTPVLPSRLRPIRTAEIAAAMVALALQPPAASAVYHHAQMRAPAAAQGGPSPQPTRPTRGQ
ncbi:MAG: NAD(P)H-binding protein [Betaproteobacteria bacterium]